jgi:hypothetical protein
MSKTNGSDGGRKPKLKPTTPVEALEILESAIMYCQHAGLAVHAMNHEGALWLALPNVHVETSAGTTRFLPGADVPATEEGNNA